MPDQKNNDAVVGRQYVACNGQGIEIFRAGRYPQGEFTELDLEIIANSYDPKVHEAPITLDHKDDGPAFGWIGAVRRVGDKLIAIPSLVTEER